MSFHFYEWKPSASPYQRLGWISFIISLLAFLLFYMAAFPCWFTISEMNYDVSYSPHSNSDKIYVGLWKRELPQISQAAMNIGRSASRNYCVSWDTFSKQTLFDGIWKFSRAVSVMGGIISVISIPINFFILCLPIKTIYFSFLRSCNGIMVVLCILLLSGLGSDVCHAENCRLGPGGYMAIMSSLLYLLATILAHRLRILNMEMAAAATRQTLSSSSHHSKNKKITKKKNNKKDIEANQQPSDTTIMGGSPEHSSSHETEDRYVVSTPRILEACSISNDETDDIISDDNDDGEMNVPQRRPVTEIKIDSEDQEVENIVQSDHNLKATQGEKTKKPKSIIKKKKKTKIGEERPKSSKRKKKKKNNVTSEEVWLANTP